jgi:hypothetical protein
VKMLPWKNENVCSRKQVANASACHTACHLVSLESSFNLEVFFKSCHWMPPRDMKFSVQWNALRQAACHATRYNISSSHFSHHLRWWPPKEAASTVALAAPAAASAVAAFADAPGSHGLASTCAACHPARCPHQQPLGRGPRMDDTPPRALPGYHMRHEARTAV